MYKKVLSVLMVLSFVFLGSASALNAVVLNEENPSLGGACGLDIVLVMDESTSIEGADFALMQTAMTGFVDALSGTPTEFALVDFGSGAVLRTGFTSDADAVKDLIDDAKMGGTQYTNWEAALDAAGALFPNRSNPNLVVFASDGNPTVSSAGPNDTNQPNAHLAPAVAEANGIKAGGTTILPIAIGNDITTLNLEAISGTGDVIVSDFDLLAADLADLAVELCGGTVSITKFVNGEQAGAGWVFDVDGESYVTDENGQVSTPLLTNGDYNVVEVGDPFGGNFTFGSATCSVGDTSNGSPVENGVGSVQVTTDSIVSCTFFNTVPTGCTDDSFDNFDPEASIDDGSCENDEEPDPEVATIVATKIVCDSEADLPNLGLGGADIDANTATAFLAENENCELAPDWEFQWGPADAFDPGDVLVGEAGEPWTTFGPTNENGITSITLTAEQIGDNANLWFREVLKEGYIPFTHDQNEVANSDDVSAEVYCNTDVLNYDNYDRIDGIAVNETYYCVAFNVAEESEENMCEDELANNYGQEGECTYTYCEFNDEILASDPLCEEPEEGEDMCKNIAGIQEEVPEGKRRTAGGNCVDKSSGGGGSSSGGSRRSGGEVLGAETEALCSFAIDTYMRKGHRNDAEQVKVLQWLLNKYATPAQPLAVDGMFGSMTEASVRAFQSKYASEILSNAWGISSPTGIFFRSTLAKAKNLECPEVATALPVGLTNDYNWSRSTNVVPPPAN